MITSYQTLNQHHGPPAVKSWCVKNNKTYVDTVKPPKEFLFTLQKCFSDVFLNKVYSLYNPTASQSKAVYWLDADFYLLLSAILIYNLSDDFKGYMPLLFPQQSL